LNLWILVQVLAVVKSKPSVSPVKVIGDETARFVSEEISIEVPRSDVTFPFEYVRPPEKVVVAPLYTNPFAPTAKPPCDKDGNENVPLTVVDEFEKSPE
jgi:hypothetical protein